MLFAAPHLEIRRPSPTTVEFTVTTQPRRSGWSGFALTALAVGIRLWLAGSAAAVVWAWWEEGGGYGGGRDFTWEATVAHTAGGEFPGEAAVTHAPAATTTAAAAARLARTVAHSVPPVLLFPLCALAAWASIVRVHTSESLLVLRGLGIQTHSTGATYLLDLLGCAASLGSWTTWVAAAVYVARMVRKGGSHGGSDDDDASATGNTPYDILEAMAAAASACDERTSALTTRFIPTEKLQDLLVNEAFRGFEVRYYLVAVVGSGSSSSSGGSAQRRSPHRRAARTGSGALNEDADSTDWRRQAGGLEENDRYGSEHGDGDDDGGYSDYGEDDNDSQEAAPLPGAEDEDHVVVVFPRLLPGLDIVRTVWREARACLYEPDDGKG